jgi:FkbM family methyltransferase
VYPKDIAVPEALKHLRPLGLFNFEFELYWGLDLVTTPGMIALETGTFCGALTTFLARRTGPSGAVHCIEASPNAIARAQTMTAFNGAAGVRFLNAFVSNQSSRETEFYEVRTQEGMAFSTCAPVILDAYPDSRRLTVPTITIDDYVEREAITPDVIKIDIEGAEYLGLLGMQRLFVRARPVIVIEIHGRRMRQVGGAIFPLHNLLLSLDYAFLDLATGEVLLKELVPHDPPMGVVLCVPKDAATVVFPDYQAKLKQWLAWRDELLSLHTEARQCMGEKPADALAMTEKLLAFDPNNSEWNYMAGFCCHMLHADPQIALHHYAVAAREGFDEFWVEYNRGGLYVDLQDWSNARRSLERARELNPNHEGVGVYLSRIPL